MSLSVLLELGCRSYFKWLVGPGFWLGHVSFPDYYGVGTHIGISVEIGPAHLETA